MNWSDEQARDEFAWLKLMASYKYDNYRDFLAGSRFFERLIVWLNQFENKDRDVAYCIIKNKLLYISLSEIEHLVAQFYNRFVQPTLMKLVAKNLSIPFHEVLSNNQSNYELKKVLRKTLFFGLSDGARISVLRHSNVGVISNEQVVIQTQIDSEKWNNILGKLREEEFASADEKFAAVFLIDDFMGTGSTFLRTEKEEWKGKLTKFIESVSKAENDLEESLFEDECLLGVHHYISTEMAANSTKNKLKNFESWNGKIQISESMVLPNEISVNGKNKMDSTILELTEKYYDHILFDENTKKGGSSHMQLGYGGCALPLVFEHNTPNNSIALLWAETDGESSYLGSDPHPMRSLFRRRSRHSY